MVITNTNEMNEYMTSKSKSKLKTTPRLLEAKKNLIWNVNNTIRFRAFVEKQSSFAKFFFSAKPDWPLGKRTPLDPIYENEL